MGDDTRNVNNSDKPVEKAPITRRKLLMTIGAAGTALLAGGLLENKALGMSVTEAVYDTEKKKKHKNYETELGIVERKLNHVWIDLEEDFPLIPPETDDTERFKRVIQHINDSGTNNRKIYLAKAEYTIASTIQIGQRGIQIIGIRHGRPNDPSGKTEGGTRINFTGTGPLFELGISGNGFSDAVQGFTLSHLNLTSVGGIRATLNNPMAVASNRGTYGLGTYAIKDNGNGNVELSHVQIERFEYGFWGMYSDVNSFDTVNLFYNKIAVFLGIGSSQNTLKELYSIGNDTVLKVKGGSGLRVMDSQFVKDGSATDAPIIVEDHHSPYDSAFFHRCWFEVGSSHRLDAFVQISCGDNAEPSKSIIFRDSCLAIGQKVNGEPLCKYFVRVGNASQILIDEVTAFPHSLKKLVAFEGNYSRQRVVFKGSVDWDYGDGTLHDQLGTGEGKLIAQKYTKDGFEFSGSPSILQPSFIRAYAGAQQAVPAASWTKVSFTVEATDITGQFDPVSSVFTAKTAGIYLVSTYVQWNQQIDANRTRMSVNLNGDAGAFAYIDDRVVGGANHSMSTGSVPVKLNPGQTVDIRVWSENAASLSPGGASTYLTILKLA